MTNRTIPPVTPQDTTKDTPQVTTQVFHRLSKEGYTELERLCGNAAVSHLTTPIQSAHQLGIQYVLTLIRNGFAVGT